MDHTPVAEQYAAAADDRLRVLVVGAGIAGVAITRLLQRDGLHPVLLERSGGTGPAGYMLALMPLVDGVFDDLDCWPAYRAASEPMRRYGVADHDGRPLREDSLGDLVEPYGDYRGISREALLEVLAGAHCPVAHRTTVAGLSDEQDGCRVTVDTPDGEQEFCFDLVIITDGLHSATRELVLPAEDLERLDTGWGGWVVWAPADADTDLGSELWGRGFLLGVYPVRDRVGAFIGGSHEATRAGPRAFADRIRTSLRTISPRTESALTALAEAEDPYYWEMADCRSARWVHGRTLLLGDAAAGFLPTAGIGAAMAMESAWVLSRTVRGAERGQLPGLLERYESEQRPRVESAQQNSRQLARYMFTDSRLAAVGRELAMRVMTIRAALGPILRLLRDRPQPRGVDTVR